MASNRFGIRTGFAIQALSVAMLALPACAGGAQGTSAKNVAPAAMTRAQQKPNGAGVGVSYKLDGVPAPGQATALVLSFDGVAQGDATVRFSADGGLTLVGGDEPRSLPAGEVTTMTLQVVPSGEGVGYVNVFTSQNRITSATSIPVQVGKSSPAMRSIGDLKPSADGEKIIAIPVK